MRTPGLAALVSLVCLSLLSACATGSYLPPNPDASIRTDEERYTFQAKAGYGAVTVVATYTNRTSQSVYIATCGEGGEPVHGLERFANGRWEQVYGASSCAAEAPAVSTEVEPDGSLVTTFEIRSYDDVPTTAGILNAEALPGVFRFNYYSVASTPGREVDDQLPEAARVSNAFELLLD